MLEFKEREGLLRANNENVVAELRLQYKKLKGEKEELISKVERFERAQLSEAGRKEFEENCEKLRGELIRRKDEVQKLRSLVNDREKRFSEERDKREDVTKRF